MTKATVKWFNPRKGFGFVAPEDGTPDAFLHISVVERAGLFELSEGAVIECEVGMGQKGPQVEAILSVTEEGAGPKGGEQFEPGEVVEGSVKWFSVEKGFGFIQREGGGKDVFVHVTALERAGINVLPEGQRVRVSTRMGRRGPQVETIELI